MLSPKLSIITVNLNNAEGLLRTIESVINQTSKEFEFIVIDGGSTDASLEHIKKYANEFSFSISERDSGIYNAMNKGIVNSSGEYLLFLNSGDWLCTNEVLSKTIPHLKIVDVISGDLDIYDAGEWHSMNSENKITVGHFFRLSLYHQATFISRDLFKRYGLYNEEFRSTGDYEFFIRTLLKNNGSYCYIPIKIANFIANGISNNPDFKELNEKEREKSWTTNFSENIVNELKEYYNLLESPELMWGKRISKRLPF